MEPLTLVRNDLLFASSLHRHTVRVLPSSKKKQQKIVVGDESGSITCITMKNRQPSTVFRLPPGKRDVTALDVVDDRIYAAFGHSITGLMKKKGAGFLSYATPLSEDILHMSVLGSHVYTGCEFSVNSFVLPSKQGQAMKEGMFYQTQGRIGGIVAVQADGGRGAVAGGSGDEDHLLVVGTHDRHVRVIKDGEVLLEHRVPAPVETLSRGWKGAGGNGVSSLWYGSDSGGVGEVLVSDGDVHSGLSIDDPHHRQGVTAITCADITASGGYDVIIGHDDGTFNLYTVPASSSSSSSAAIDAASPAYSYELHESVVSLDSGCIQSADATDLVVATYSGKILTFGHDSQSTATIGKLETAETGHKHRVMVNLQADIDGLAKQLAMYKEKLSKLNVGTEAAAQAVLKPAEDTVSALPVKSSYRLWREQACHLLSLEIPVSIELCVLHCTLPLVVAESNDDASASRTVMSEQPTGGAEGSDYINVIRLTDSVNRLSLSLRCLEGDSGLLSCYVVPKTGMNPLASKTSNKVLIAIKPLCLHERQPERLHADADPALSCLTLSGQFSLAEAHTWLTLCLPDIPPHTPSVSSSDLYYQNVYSHGLLYIRYGKGQLQLDSDNLSALLIIKEVISREAIIKKIHVDFQFAYNNATVPQFLGRLRTRLDYYLTLQYKVSLIAALEELSQHEEKCTDFLEPEYMEILQQKEQLRAEHKSTPMHLSMLQRLLVSLFVDKGKLQGRDVSRQSGRVLEVMKEKYSFEALLALYRDG